MKNDGALLDLVGMQNLMVYLSSIAKIKKCIEVYGGPDTMVVHLIHLKLIN
jgi:hypothetical protein